MTLPVRIIRSKNEYQEALKRLSDLMTAEFKAGSDAENEFELLRLVIGAYEAQSAPRPPVDPIEAINLRLDQQGLGKKDLAPYIGSMSRVSDVLAGRRQLTVAMMRRLHKGLGVPAASLIGDGDLDEEIGGELPDYDFTKFPLVEMMERGCFGNIKYGLAKLRANAEELVAPLLRPLCGKVTQPQLLRARLHQSGSRTMDEHALLIWRVLVVKKARKSPPRAPFKHGSITNAWLRDLAKLSAFDGGPRLAHEFLSKHGICLVFERHFAKTYLDGAAMLDGDQPIVALTLRHDRLDNFWFALLHELVHVARHLRANHLFIADNLEDKTRKGQAEEDEADAGAQEALLPAKLWAKAAVTTTHSVSDALEVAREAGVHPAIVAGRLRHETGNWRLLSNLVSDAGSVRQYFEEQLA
jgi:HTH-type transcriptional regulator/antitoxin HigA